MMYSVVRRETGHRVKMSTGLSGRVYYEPETIATIYRNGEQVTSLRLNAVTLCLPGGSVYGLAGTDDQIVRAVLGDEDVFTGAPSWPGHHDQVVS